MSNIEELKEEKLLESEREYLAGLEPKMSKDEYVRRFWARQEKKEQLKREAREWRANLRTSGHSTLDSQDSLTYLSPYELGL